MKYDTCKVYSFSRPVLVRISHTCTVFVHDVLKFVTCDHFSHCAIGCYIETILSIVVNTEYILVHEALLICLCHS